MQKIIFGGGGTTIATLIALVLIFVSLYYSFYALSHYKMPQYMKGLTILLTMFTIYGLLLMLSGRRIVALWGYIANYNYLKKIYISLLPIFPFYVFTKQGKLNEQGLHFWILAFIVTNVVSFRYTSQSFLLELGEEESTNNLGYSFLSLIPLLVFLKNNRTIQYVGLGTIMILVLLCFKRGAIIIGAICVAFFLFQTTKNSDKKRKPWTTVLSIAIIIIGIFYVENLLENSEYFNKRLNDTIEGESSGRDDLFSSFWNHFIDEDNVWIFLFGNGANATLTVSVNYAHNDWLELAINQGVLGLVIYLVYWIMFYKSWRYSTFDNDLHLAIGLSLLIYFLRTFFSMSYGAMTLYSNVCIGYCMARLGDKENSFQIIQ